MWRRAVGSTSRSFGAGSLVFTSRFLETTGAVGVIGPAMRRQCWAAVGVWTDGCRDDAGSSAFDGFFAGAVDGFANFSVFRVVAGAAGCLSGPDGFEVFMIITGAAAVAVGGPLMTMTFGVSGGGADLWVKVFLMGDEVGTGCDRRLGSSIRGVVEPLRSRRPPRSGDGSADGSD